MVANIERAANLFLVKNVYSLVLAVIVAFTHTAYPFAPIQLTLISAVTIGIPGFALALGPNHRRYVPGFLNRVLRFAIPVGVVTGVSAYAGYAATILLDHGSNVAQGRTTPTLTVLIISMWTVLVLAWPLTGWKLVLVAGLAVAAIIGAAGALLVKLTHRSILLLVRLATKDSPLR